MEIVREAIPKIDPDLYQNDANVILKWCKSDAELSMERGIKYFDWGKYDQAILEFNKAKYLQLLNETQSYDDLKLLAQTHYNLAITYAK